jgi:hypothetical protein
MTTDQTTGTLRTPAGGHRMTLLIHVDIPPDQAMWKVAALLTQDTARSLQTAVDGIATVDLLVEDDDGQRTPITFHIGHIAGPDPDAEAAAR